MGKWQLYFHLIILVAAVVVGMWSIWEDGLIPEGKNHPNFSALAMVLMVIGQIAGIKAYQNQKKKEL
jgi:succinate dehydrogenase hydrophobic anchor subunit